MSENPFEYLSAAKKAKKDKEDKENEIRRQEYEALQQKRDYEEKQKKEKRDQSIQKYNDVVQTLLKQLITIEYPGCHLDGWKICKTNEWSNTWASSDDVHVDHYSETYVYVGVELVFDENDFPTNFLCWRDLQGSKVTGWGLHKSGKEIVADLSSQSLLLALKELHPPVDA